MNDLVVSRPESVQVHHFFVVLDDRLHLEVGLVGDNVVHLLEFYRRQNFVELLSQMMSPVTRQENSCVSGPFDKGVNDVSISLDS